MEARLEALLFISAKPIAIKQLAEVLECKPEEVEAAGKALQAEYAEKGRGIQIVSNSGKLQMVSASEHAARIQKFLADETGGELSRPSLETLTIIAYRGPIRKIDLERIRGVNCSLIIRNLLLRGLVEEKKDKEESSYVVTFDFLRFLGVSDVKELPDYERLSKEETLNQTLDD